MWFCQLFLMWLFWLFVVCVAVLFFVVFEVLPSFLAVVPSVILHTILLVIYGMHINCPGGLMYFCFRNKSLCGSQYLTPIPRTVAREVCETGYFVAQDTYLKYHRSHGSAQTYSGVLTVRTNRHLEKVKTR